MRVTIKVDYETGTYDMTLRRTPTADSNIIRHAEDLAIGNVTSDYLTQKAFLDQAVEDWANDKYSIPQGP